MYQICFDALSIPLSTEALHILEEHIANQGLPNDSKIDQVSGQKLIFKVCQLLPSVGGVGTTSPGAHKIVFFPMSVISLCYDL